MVKGQQDGPGGAWGGGKGLPNRRIVFYSVGTPNSELLLVPPLLIVGSVVSMDVTISGDGACIVDFWCANGLAGLAGWAGWLVSGCLY